MMLNESARAHLEKYWRLSRERFEAGDCALAAFLAITLIEEVGKVVILEDAKMGDSVAKRDFRNHQSKYVYAVGATLAVNSRVTRVYGKDEVRFAEWFRTEKLFSIRNSALYLELRGTDIVVPEQVIHRADALLLVCIAGEVYAEIQGRQTGTGPAEWQRILSEVDKFRVMYGTSGQSAVKT
jgi:AbiV family abortive infection protein